MIAAVIALALAIVGMVVVDGLLVRALLSGLRSERASFAAEVLAGKAQVAAELGQRHAERAREIAEDSRDEALAAQARGEAERDSARERLRIEGEALAKVLEENADATVTKIRSAPTIDDAITALNELLCDSGRGDVVDGAPPLPDRGG